MKKKKKLNESIVESALSPLAYCALIDASSIFEKNRSLLMYMFPQAAPSEIKKWFRKLIYSDDYKNYSEKLKGISERFSNNTNLKVLYKSIDALKSTPFSDQERSQRENDIQTMIGKVSYYIKKRLSDEDSVIFDELSSILNTVATNVASQIDSDLDSVVQSTPEPEKTPEPKEEPSKTESKISERMKNKLKRKIKEIVRTHLMVSGKR
jgi:hypothetical protein